ncbi:hypothetical protein K431DRAFT_300046 [Polychaeton citri CBS 116435]|uniref:Uncharacterized protein n=1 Tax=Polychaeton citri CBS 116435 TaxID=1314669 RepID=A0A9P4QHS7_9PEZI|nr:hypothetical protein K431DRAFT_300046 [Polychaeton citri CBS 116435]
MASQLSTETLVQVITTTQGPKINDQQFQGWYIHPEGSLEAIDCPSSQSLLSTDSFAECCDIGASTCTTLWTSCDGRTAVGVSSDDCGEGSVCRTVSIFDQLPLNGEAPLSQIICGPSDWVASSIYRTVITTSTTSSGAISSVPSSTTSVTSSSTNSYTSASIESGVFPTTTSSPKPSSASKAWIAGAVVGPVAGIAIIAAMVWALYRRRKSRQNRGTSVFNAPPVYTDDHNGSANMQSAAGTQLHEWYQGGQKDNRNSHQLSENQIHEMSAKPAGPYELTGS